MMFPAWVLVCVALLVQASPAATWCEDLPDFSHQKRRVSTAFVLVVPVIPSPAAAGLTRLKGSTATPYGRPSE
ncbi:unnamed protein product [Diplocarpon coronariae]